MADTTEVKWLYPPNWDGFIPDNTGFRKMRVRLTGISDGTGETDVVKVARGDLKTHNYNTPSKIGIEKIEWLVHGLTAVLEWDSGSDQIITRINGGVSADSTSGETCFKDVFYPDDDTGTGNIMLTTSNCNSGDTYDIILNLRLKD